MSAYMIRNCFSLLRMLLASVVVLKSLDRERYMVAIRIIYAKWWVAEISPSKYFHKSKHDVKHEIIKIIFYTACNLKNEYTYWIIPKSIPVCKKYITFSLIITVLLTKIWKRGENSSLSFLRGENVQTIYFNYPKSSDFVYANFSRKLVYTYYTFTYALKSFNFCQSALSDSSPAGLFFSKRSFFPSNTVWKWKCNTH